MQKKFENYILSKECARCCRIYLIDHAWTYRPDQARAYLESMPSLLSRMATLMDIDADRPQDDVIEDVLTSMWRCLHDFSILYVLCVYCLLL